MVTDDYLWALMSFSDGSLCLFLRKKFLKAPVEWETGLRALHGSSDSLHHKVLQELFAYDAR